MSLAAVFSPTPGTPGRLSDGSPRSAAYCDVLRRRDAGALLDAGLVVERVVGHAPPVVEHLDVRVLDELVGVAVAGDDEDVVAVGRAPASASVAMMSSASKPAQLDRSGCRSVSTTWRTRPICWRRMSGAASRFAL